MAVGSEFARFMNPVLDALRGLGESGRPAEVYEYVAETMNVSEDELGKKLKDGTSRFENQVAWARHYLARTGFIDSSRYGVWSLTEKGKEAQLSDQEIENIIRQVQHETASKRALNKGVRADQKEESEDEIAPQVKSAARTDHREELTNILYSLSPEGFERLCQRLLREAGYQEVTVTGRSGDGGIDGKGILQVSPLVSFKVLFQCKRYQGTVGASQIRDFQGAMRGRADKGIFLTTGNFSSDARKEATRDGADPVELIDLNKMLELFEALELGLSKQVSYSIDEGFFDEFT